MRFIPAPAGELGRRGAGARLSDGSSPRLRGTLVLPMALKRRHRFIPAPAGNSPARSCRHAWASVHPRACGELQVVGVQPVLAAGSSPRLRGTRRGAAPRLPPGTVHPRACGELDSVRAFAAEGCGSSPRLRGTPNNSDYLTCWYRFIPAPAGNSMCCAASSAPVAGSSPRLRGTLLLASRNRRRLRFIPAPAGNSARSGNGHGRLPVHPRACGELYMGPQGERLLTGSSPRLRGTHRSLNCPGAVYRFIPAPAGNSSRLRRRTPDSTVHPRACGELASGRRLEAAHNGSSPRLRGTPKPSARFIAVFRFIPAPAGNSGFALLRLGVSPVHPRACGELAGVIDPPGAADGSSPRLRGTPLPTTCCQISRYGTLYTVPWDFGPGAMMKNLKLAGLVAWESPGGWVAARTLQASFRRNPRARAGSCRTCQSRNRCRSALPRQ